MKKHTNKFLKSVAKNVDLAFKYDPNKQDRPNFRFYGVSMSDADNTKASTMPGGPMFLRDSELGDYPMIDPDGYGANIPERFLNSFRADDDGGRLDADMRVRPSKRKRNVPSYYEYDFTSLNERHVDKFRVATKTGQEEVASEIFKKRHNDVFEL